MCTYRKNNSFNITEKKNRIEQNKKTKNIKLMYLCKM